METKKKMPNASSVKAKPIQSKKSPTKKSATKATVKAAVKKADDSSSAVISKKRKTPAKATSRTTKAGPSKASKKTVKKAQKPPVLQSAKQTPPKNAQTSNYESRRQAASAIYFSLEEVREVISLRQKEKSEGETPRKIKKEAPQSKAPQKKLAPQHSIRTAASTRDILGFNLQDTQSANPTEKSEAHVPKKFLKYYRSLVKLRTHVLQELDLHTRDTFQHASKDDNSAPLGTKEGDSDTIDQEFALSLVSSEQGALFEIEEAIKRIFNNTYGICEITGKPISRDRLSAVPFTRFSIEGQSEFENRSRQTRDQYRALDFFADSDVRDREVFSGDDDGE